METDITDAMFKDEGIHMALARLHEEVLRYRANEKKNSYICGERIIAHQIPHYYATKFITLSKELKTPRYYVLLAALMLLLDLPEGAQRYLIDNARQQFLLLRDSTPETLDAFALEKLMDELSHIGAKFDQVFTYVNDDPVDAHQGM